MRFAPVILVLTVACSIGGSGATTCPMPVPATARFTSHAHLLVDVADDDASREHGLMGVTDLAPNRGMAFVWTAPTDATFWMKDTLIPLSIAFVDQGGQVLALDEMAPCTHDPCPTYAAPAPYTTAVEANPGWFAQHRVKVGDVMTLELPACA